MSDSAQLPKWMPLPPRPCASRARMEWQCRAPDAVLRQNIARDLAALQATLTPQDRQVRLS